MQSSLLSEQLAELLSLERCRLYKIIWKRTLASQMIHANLKRGAVEFKAAQGHHYPSYRDHHQEAGFMSVYLEMDYAFNERTVASKENAYYLS